MDVGEGVSSGSRGELWGGVDVEREIEAGGSFIAGESVARWPQC